MSEDDHKGIANILNLPRRSPVRKQKVETQVTPELTNAEILMNMRPLDLPKREKPVVRKDSLTDQYNKYFNTKSKSYYKNQTPKLEKLPIVNRKIGVGDYIKKTRENYNDTGGERFVNKTLNKFENRTTNPSVVTFDPTTQLFTDETRNIAFKSYDQAKRWNDAINNEDTKEPRKNDSNPKNPHRRLI